MATPTPPPSRTLTRTRRAASERRLAAVAAALTLSLPTIVAAEEAVSKGPTRVAQVAAETETELLPVRVALSEKAAERLFELRVRRLLAIELDGVATVESRATGPLGGEVIRVWIDTPNPRRALIEVRRGSRSVARRTLAVSDFPADVAARVATIAAAEMVRVQAGLGTPSPGPEPSGDEGLGETEDAPVALDASIVSLVLPASDPTIVFGPGLALEHRSGISSQTLFARLLVGDGDHQRLRWLELGGSLGIRWAVAERVRLRFGAAASGVALDLPAAVTIDGRAIENQQWTARATAILGAELRIEDRTWLALCLEPGGVIRDLDLTNRQGITSGLGGFALGINLALSVAP